MGIAQGATPYLVITIEGYDLSDAAAVVVTLLDKKRVFNLNKNRVSISSNGSDSILTVHLTQTETLALMPNSVMIQVRWRDAGGEAHTTEMAQIDVATAIYRGVI